MVSFDRDLVETKIRFGGFVDMALRFVGFFSEGIRGPWGQWRVGGSWLQFDCIALHNSGGPWWLGIVSLGEAGGEV